MGSPVVYSAPDWKGEEVEVSVYYIHNAYLGFFYTTGIIGLALCLAWALGLVRTAWARVLVSPNPTVPVLLVASTLFTAVSLITAVVIGNLNGTDGAGLFGAVAGLGLSKVGTGRA